MKFWITRNKRGTLVVWSNKPVKIEEEWYGDLIIVLDSYHFPTFGEVIPFPEITFENSPQQVELKLI